MLPSQSPFIARHHSQHSGSCAGLPPSAAVPPHFHYAPVHHHPQQGLYVGGGQSAGARCASRQCDVTSMPPPTAPSTSGDNMAELNPFQLMASTSYTHRYNDSIFLSVSSGNRRVNAARGGMLVLSSLGHHTCEYNDLSTYCVVFFQGIGFRKVTITNLMT